MPVLASDRSGWAGADTGGAVETLPGSDRGSDLQRHIREDRGQPDPRAVLRSHQEGAFADPAQTRPGGSRLVLERHTQRPFEFLPR